MSLMKTILCYWIGVMTGMACCISYAPEAILPALVESLFMLIGLVCIALWIDR